MIDLHAPHGAPWELLVACAVVLLAPMVARRFRLPALIGFVVGGVLVGPHVLGWLEPGVGSVPALGELGLLYLMFLAGLELDLRSLRSQRAATVGFGVATFLIPFVAGWGSGLLLEGGRGDAALLLGVLWASHTLVAYPVVRAHGLARTPAVIAAVGGTVITDVLALVVLAGVAGSAADDGGGPAHVALQVATGLAVLAAYCALLLPRAGRWFFAGPGQDRAARFVFVLGALLSAAVVAEVLGIEPIVGSFFAGLALNRLVPAEGPLMERIEFLGSSIFVPFFLISVGLLVDPAQLVEPATLALAGVLLVVALASKAVAAALAATASGFGASGFGLMFALSSTRASATLAATFVGFDLGIFDDELVNAVLVVVLVTLVVGTTAAEQVARRAEPEPEDPERLGTRVVLPLDRLETVPALLRVAQLITSPDKGVVLPVRVVDRREEADLDSHREFTADADARAAAEKLECHASLRVDSGYEAGVLHTVIGERASLLLLDVRPGRREHGLLDPQVRDIVAGSPVPVALARLDPAPEAEIERVVVMLSPSRRGEPTTLAAGRLTMKLAELFVANGLPALVVAADRSKGEREAKRLGGEVEVDPRGPVHWAGSAPRSGDLLLLPFRPGRHANAKLLENLADQPGVSVISVAEPHAQAWPRGVEHAPGQTGFASRRAPLP